MKKVTGVISYQFDNNTYQMNEPFEFIFNNDVSDGAIRNEIKNKNTVHNVFTKDGTSQYKKVYRILSIVNE